ncbi:MAG: 5'-nucleotidase C-terminal domain-containing protein [Candidatus Kariarchaeaceae archaeon]|jgi:2',3'-cyclic-nucleotide 2'-phosphodiesterase/3'-nucleotidase
MKFGKYTLRLVVAILSIVLLYSTSAVFSQTDQVTPNLTIFTMNDIHGQFTETEEFPGIPRMYTSMLAQGYDPDDPSTLLLDAGDHFTGGALTSMSKGEMVIDAMNTMGVDAAAMGNHELDFGAKWLDKLDSVRDHPLLSANTYEAGTDEVPDFLDPWVVLERNGINVGIIGLTTTQSAFEFLNDQVRFEGYEESVRGVYDDVINAGADIVIILAHEGASVLNSLASKIADLNIALIISGHLNAAVVETTSGITLVESGAKSQNFGKLELYVDTETDQTTVISADVKDTNPTIEENEALLTVMKAWHERIPTANLEISSSHKNLDQNEMGKLLADSYLHYFRVEYGLEPNIALPNRARTLFEGGTITVGDVFSAFPHNDTLVNFTASGMTIRSSLASAAQGLENRGGQLYILVGDNYEVMDTSKNYSVIVDSFTYELLYKDLFEATYWDMRYSSAAVCYIAGLDSVENHITFNEGYLPGDHSMGSCQDINTEPRPHSVGNPELTYVDEVVKMSWEPNTESYFQNYVVHRNGSMIISNRLTANIDPDVQPGNTYQYEVRAQGEDGQLSLPVLFEIQIEALPDNTITEIETTSESITTSQTNSGVSFPWRTGIFFLAVQGYYYFRMRNRKRK